MHSFVVKNLLKGAPSILGSLLYVCAESFRCFQSASSDVGLLRQCENPILPTFCLTIYLFWTWLLSVLAPPLVTNYDVTWSDIARLEVCVLGVSRMSEAMTSPRFFRMLCSHLRSHAVLWVPCMCARAHVTSSLPSPLLTPPPPSPFPLRPFLFHSSSPLPFPLSLGSLCPPYPRPGLHPDVNVCRDSLRRFERGGRRGLRC